jgi:hypothetical protein
VFPVTDRPYVLVWASREAPLEVNAILGNGASIPHMITASKVLSHEGDAHLCVVSVPEPGPGLVVGEQEYPGTHTLALMTLDDLGDVVLETGAGMPPTSAFLWTASVMLDCMARFHVTGNLAQQAQRRNSLLVAPQGPMRMRES